LNERGIYISDINGENIKKLLVGDYSFPRFLPATSRIFLVKDGNTLMIYERETQNITKLAHLSGEISSVAMSPKGERVALIVTRDEYDALLVYSFSTGEISNIYQAEHLSMQGNQSWSFDARWLAFTQHNKDWASPKLVLWNQMENTVTQLTDAPDAVEDIHDGDGYAVWSPIDYRLAFAHVEKFSFHLHILDFSQSSPLFTETDVVSNQPAFLWSPDAKYLLLDGIMVVSIISLADLEKQILFEGGVIGNYALVNWLTEDTLLLLALGSCGGKSKPLVISPRLTDLPIAYTELWEDNSPHKLFPSLWEELTLSYLSPDISLITQEIIFVGILDPYSG
jgi:hypothetical protein